MSRNQWRGILASAGLTAAVVASSATVAGGVAAAAPGTPGTPQAPIVLHTEDFENAPGEDAVQITNYTGAPPLNVTYTASPTWLSNCNGWILNESTPQPPNAPECENRWSDRQSTAGVLSRYVGTGAGNHVLTEYSPFRQYAADEVVVETTTPIPLSPGSRFVTFSLDATEILCPNKNSSLLKLYLMDGGTAIPAFSSPIEPCVQASQTVDGFPVGTFTSNAPVLYSGTSLGWRLVNGQGGLIGGNTLAIDNVRVLDVTPQLDKTFSPATSPQLGETTLTYTVTNSGERAVKNGWSFTDTAPAGLSVVAGSESTNCAGGTVSATAGTVTVSGNLTAGQDACTATVRMTAAVPGVYQSCGTDVTAVAGLVRPGCASVSFTSAPSVDAGGSYSGHEGAKITITGQVSDPDSPNVTAGWTVTPETGVDPGATCVFGDAAALTTTVTCTDDGVYRLTLTADDGLNPPVTATAPLTLSNAAPTVAVTEPANGASVRSGGAVTVAASFTDLGTNDTHTCVVDFGDGTAPVTGVTGNGVCTAGHVFTALGPHTVTVTVTDDDGGTGEATVAVVVFTSGEAWAVSGTGPVEIEKTPHAACPPDTSLIWSGLGVPGVADLGALKASCTVSPTTGVTEATSSVGNAELLGGAISIEGVDSTCVAGPDGLTGTSRVGAINGQPIGTDSGSITIPLVATIHHNQTVTTPAGELFQYAIRVETLLGQEILLGACRIG